jgi:copper chaperone CopZ
MAKPGLMSEKEILTIKRIPVMGMDCPTCASVIENEIKKLKGVKEVQTIYVMKIVKVTYDPNYTKLTDIEAAIERVGYQVAYKTYPSAASKIKNFFKKQKTAPVGTVTDMEFRSKVLHNSKPVAVLFYSPTCRPCQIAKEAFLQAAEQAGKDADFLEMDVTSTETWHTYEITVTPTTIIFIDGEPKTKLISIPEKQEIMDAVSMRKN